MTDAFRDLAEYNRKPRTRAEIMHDADNILATATDIFAHLAHSDRGPLDAETMEAGRHAGTTMQRGLVLEAVLDLRAAQYETNRLLSDILGTLISGESSP